MSENTSERTPLPVWAWRTIVGAGTLAGILVAFFGIQEVFEKKMEKVAKAQSAIIVQEIHEKAETTVEFLKDDLWDRIKLLEVEMDSRSENNEPIPERMRMHYRAMKERYQEMKDPWKD